jgi:dephospho-CoA kinase
MELTQLVEAFGLKPYKAKLREISKEMVNSKSKAQNIAHPLMRSENPTTTGKAHKMMQVIKEIAARGQKRMLLRRLGVNQKRLETSSTETPAASDPI